MDRTPTVSAIESELWSLGDEKEARDIVFSLVICVLS